MMAKLGKIITFLAKWVPVVIAVSAAVTQVRKRA